jgi:hypothetical protein
VNANAPLRVPTQILMEDLRAMECLRREKWQILTYDDNMHFIA